MENKIPVLLKVKRRVIMNIKFSNNSTLKSIETENNRRGIRSNFITCMCYDTSDDEFIMKTLDLREPIDRYVPEWLLMRNIIN